MTDENKNPLDLEEKNNLNLKTTKLQDGTEIISENTESEEEQEVDEKSLLTDKDLQKLVEFTTGVKNLTEDELTSLREDDKELERLLRISAIKLRHFNYNPKKKFDKAYRKKRQRRNNLARASRRANR